MPYSKPWKYSSEIVERYPDIYDYLDNQIISKSISYIINSDYRRAIRLKPWIREQVENPSNELKELANQLKGGSIDRTMTSILRWVRKNKKYALDSKTSNMLEYWNTAQESLERTHLDCEDGAILIYVLARLAGVPTNRLYLLAGNVWDPFRKKIAGHAWCAYKPDLYPHNWAFMDWCYYYDQDQVPNRTLFTLLDKTIYSSDKDDSRYRSIWFFFNEQKSHTRLLTKLW